MTERRFSLQAGRLLRAALPFTRWISELRSFNVLRADLLAGLAVALVVIPQSMSYAQLADLPPYVGLYASVLPCMIAALFGSSRQLTTGPVAIASLMTATGLSPLAGGDMTLYIMMAMLLAIMVGVIQLALGLLRLGVLVNFLSHPVILGFTNAAALIIASSQLAKLFGVTVEAGAHQYETVWRILSAALTDTHWPTLLLGIATILLVVAMRRYLPKWPGVLVAITVVTVVSWLTNYGENGGAIVGAIPAGLPEFQIPYVELSKIREMITLALVIAVLGFVEAISIAKAMATQTRQRLSADQELIGQGLSNLAAGVSQGYPVSGSFSRSAVNFDAGAVTGFSSMVTGLLVALFLFALTPILYHLPLSGLAAVIITSVVKLLNWEAMLHVWRVQRHDGIVAITTFVMTVMLAPHLEDGIILGVALSLVLYLYRTSKPRILEMSRHIDGTLRHVDLFNLSSCARLSLLRFDGSLFFANVGHFEEEILRRATAKPSIRYLLLDCEGVNEIDTAGVDSLRRVNRQLQDAGIELLLARVKRQTLRALEASGLADEIGLQRRFRIRHHAVAYVWRSMDGCPRGECPAVCPLSQIKSG